MKGALLAAALVAAGASAAQGQLPPAPRRIFDVTWRRPLVAPTLGQWRPIEPGGPVVDAETGLVVVGTRDGWLHAFRADGTRAWEFQGSGSFGAPVAVDGGVVFAGTGGGTLYALDLASGKLRWRYEVREELGTRPVVANGLVVVASLEDTVVAVGAADGAWRWQHRRDPRGGFTIRGAAPVVVSGGTAFAAYSDGFVAALDLGSGKARWERKVAPDGKYADVDGLALGDGRLFAAAYSGAVVALDPATGKTLWSAALPEASRLAFVDGMVVAVTPTIISARAPDSGTPIWEAPMGDGSPAAAPVRAGRWLAVPAGPAGLRFLEPATGRLVRILDGGQGMDAAVAVAGRRGYALANGGTLLAFDLP